MALNAYRLFSRAEHGVRGFVNQVIAMAYLTLGEPHPVMCGLVRAVDKKVARESVTLGADIPNSNGAGSGGIMATVTTVACRSGAVAALQERLAVDAPIIFLKLILF